MENADCTVIITTRNRLPALKISLEKLKKHITLSQVLICDDGGTDGTDRFVQETYPEIQFIQNKKGIGLIASRNRLMGMVKTSYAVSLDDDLNFLTENPFKAIQSNFEDNTRCAVVGFRIFWGLKEPSYLETIQTPERVKNYPGGAHAFRMEAWREIEKYPEWYIFYGEEDFASLQLFKKGWEVYSLPEVLTHHRVDLKARKSNNVDYVTRTRRALHAAWSNYLIFYPKKTIPRKMAYSIFQQLKRKVFKGDFLALRGILRALRDLIKNSGKRKRINARLTEDELKTYERLPDFKLYWVSEE